MKKIVAIITAVVITANIIAGSALAATAAPVVVSPVKQAAPQKQIKCLPVCALPLIPELIILLTRAVMLMTMVTITVTTQRDVPIALERKQGGRPQQIIYRSGTGGNVNMTPRDQDTDGLSYSNAPMPGQDYTATTCEAINATRVLMCYQDPMPGKQWHYLVRAVDVRKHAEWIKSRPTADTKPHEFTKMIQTLSVKVKAS